MSGGKFLVFIFFNAVRAVAIHKWHGVEQFIRVCAKGLEVGELSVEHNALAMHFKFQQSLFHVVMTQILYIYMANWATSRQ